MTTTNSYSSPNIRIEQHIVHKRMVSLELVGRSQPKVDRSIHTLFLILPRVDIVPGEGRHVEHVTWPDAALDPLVLPEPWEPVSVNLIHSHRAEVIAIVPTIALAATLIAVLVVCLHVLGLCVQALWGPYCIVCSWRRLCYMLADLGARQVC